MTHILPDYVRPGLDVIFCGTAAGQTSAARGHYYARPGNRFWPILAETGLTPRRLLPQEDHLMPDFGLGLTDLAKFVSGQDSEILRSDYLPDHVFDLIRNNKPRALAFTSLAAARNALGDSKIKSGRLPDQAALPGIAVWVLPSPSGLATRHFSIAPWQALADWRKGLP